MGGRAAPIPLTDFRRELLAVLAPARTPDSDLAGGAALHFAPNSTRYSHDLDFFHDATERVAEAYARDRALLLEAGYDVDVTLSQRRCDSTACLKMVIARPARDPTRRLSTQ